MWYFRNSVYLNLFFRGFRFSCVFLSVAMGFIMSFFVAEPAGHLRTTICFLMALLATHVTYSWELSMVNGVNIYSPRSSAVIFGDVVILFFALVSLWVKLWRVS
jgi:hypothetical protein